MSFGHLPVDAPGDKEIECTTMLCLLPFWSFNDWCFIFWSLAVRYSRKWLHLGCDNEPLLYNIPIVLLLFFVQLDDFWRHNLKRVKFTMWHPSTHHPVFKQLDPCYVLCIMYFVQCYDVIPLLWILILYHIKCIYFYPWCPHIPD